MRRFFTTMFTMLLCGTMMTQMADAQSRGRGRQNGEGGSRTENVQRPSRQHSNRQEGFSRRENNRPANISRPENKRPGNNVGNFRPANNNSGNGNGFNRPGNMGNRDQHTVNPGNLNRPGNNGNRPGNGYPRTPCRQYLLGNSQRWYEHRRGCFSQFQKPDGYYDRPLCGGC